MTPVRVLACAAATAALLAAIAGSPHVSSNVDVAALARDITARRDAISALELAEWIRDRRGVQLFDLRSQAAFDEFAIPTAVRSDLSTLIDMSLARTDTVVLYGGDAPQGWVLLRTRNIEHAYLLRGGVSEWVSAVLNPTLPEIASASEEAAFARVAELSRYFGGVPRRGEPPPGAAALDLSERPAADAAVQAVLRRGCDDE